MMGPMATSLIAPMTSSLIKPVASSLINTITRRGVRRTGKGQESGFLPFSCIFIGIIKGIDRKDIIRAGTGYNKMDPMGNIF